MIKVFICNSNAIILEGLKSVLHKHANIELVGDKLNAEKLLAILSQTQPDVLIIDYTSEFFQLQDIKSISTVFPNIKMIGITDYKNKSIYKSALDLGLKGHILNCCDKKEVIDAVTMVHEGNQFFCGKVLAVIHQEDQNLKLSCSPVSLSDRELEVIGLIAEGLTNKEIALKLFLSAHTVMTHRKNIMNKLGVNNTAGIVLFAVKQNLIGPNKFLFETMDA